VEETAKVKIFGNQPFFQQLILSELEKEGYCEINPEKKEVTFIKYFA
jgi:hypothetical protein